MVEDCDHSVAHRSAGFRHGNALSYWTQAAGGVSAVFGALGWSLNAAASVMGSAGAIMRSIYFSLIQTLLIGGALYLAALLVLRSSFEREAAR